MNDDIKTEGKFKTTFHKLFSYSHILYTVLFFVIIIVITVLSLFPRENIGNIVLMVTISFSLTYIILMILGMVPQLDPHLFSPQKKDTIKKFGILLITFGICFVLILLYFVFGSSSQLAIQFFGWNIILPYLCVFIYFGWNLIQIFFIRIIFENISNKVDEKLISETKNPKTNRNKTISMIFLIISITIPFLIQLGTYFGLIPYFEQQSPADPIEPFYWFSGWNIAMIILILLVSYRVIFLYIKSLRNETPNVFSSIFYIFIWFYIWYRSFSFIWSFRKDITTVQGLDFVRVTLDFLLMIVTSILVLKNLGDKLVKYRIFTPNNLLLFLFAFTILYFEGQIIMIVGAGSISEGTYTTQSQVNLVNNFLIILISVIFYWWYSEFILERKNLIFKKTFNHTEVISLIKDFKGYLENTGAIEPNKISEFELQNFLKSKKLKSKKSEPKI